MALKVVLLKLFHVAMHFMLFALHNGNVMQIWLEPCDALLAVVLYQLTMINLTWVKIFLLVMEMQMEKQQLSTMP